MNTTDIKQKIKEAIQQFGNGNLSENALNLFQVLGYITERRAPLGKPTYATFKDSFIDAQSRFDENKALVKEWKYVDLLFQLSKEEVSKQLSLFDTKQVDRTVIETYLFFAIELAKEHYSRTELSYITREVNRLFPMPVMILFKHGLSLTLSVINRRLHKQDDSKDVLEKVTLIKDILISPAGGGVRRTGVENEAGTHRAHIEIIFDLSFDELKNKHGFTNFVELHNAWQKTLDTKELNKRFFRDLANWYFWAMDCVEFPDDLEKKKDIRNATNLIRLITRVVFIWFIKEKDLVPEILFNKNQLNTILNNFNKNEKSDTYYKAILQNLFFGTLNQKMGERGFAKEGSFLGNKNEYGVKNLFRYADKLSIKEKEIIELFSDIPFLNGGLFDCLDKPNDEGKIVYVDGFSRNPKKQAKVPDFLFFSDELEVDLNEIYGTRNKKYKAKGLINLLNSYKFTVAENTPIEEEIALDPELLGKVFENLLASYNPETQTTARKQTGSFYTPREIVNYMVDESLLAYLKQKLEGAATSDSEARLRDLLSYSDNPNPFNKKETQVLIAAIDTCKILDPACGSGAFPMGILHKLVHLLHKLDTDNEQWKALQYQKAIAETEEAFKIGCKEEREIHLLEINEVFDQNINNPDYARKLYLVENCIYGVDIQPIAVQIAKLRFFISLIIDQKKQAGKDNFGIRSLPNLETKFVSANTLIGIEKPRQRSFKTPEMDKLEKDLKQLRHQYFNAKTRKEKLRCQKQDKAMRQKIAKLLVNDGWGATTAQQIIQFDPYDQNASSPFFDPEWMFGLTDGFDVVIGNPPYGFHQIHSKFEKDYFKNNYVSSKGSFEHYFLFYEKALRLINEDGLLSFIAPVTWLTIPSAFSLRKFVLSNYFIREICWLSEKVFEQASVNTLISLIQVRQNKEVTIKICNSFDNFPYQSSEIRKLNKSNFISNNYYIGIFEDENDNIILEIILRETKPLSHYARPCSGYNPYEVGKGRTLEGTPHTKETVQTKPYHSNEKLGEEWKPEIIGRNLGRYSISISGKRWIKYGHWLAAPRDSNNFIGKRILVQEITGGKDKRIIAAYCDQELYHSRDVIPIKFESEFPHPFYILGIINSKLITWYHHRRNPKAQKDLFPKVLVSDLENLPIKESSNQNTYSIIVNYIICQKKHSKDSSFFELIIDAMVYELYLPDEIKAADCEVLKHIAKLLEFKDDWSDEKKLAVIEKVYKELSDPKHPVSVAMAKMQEIPEVKIIEGRDKE